MIPRLAPWTRRALSVAGREEITAATPPDWFVTIRREDNWNRGWTSTIYDADKRQVVEARFRPSPIAAFRAARLLACAETVHWRDCDVEVTG
jgi:hypothetical protein